MTDTSVKEVTYRGERFTFEVCTLEDIAPLFKRYHAYKGVGDVATYAFAVSERRQLVAGFTWNAPAFGAAKSACADIPQGVLSLTRMVALPRKERTLRHLSKPLRYQMLKEIDRTRWPVLITYSDESLGHDGNVYKCSGWQKTKRSLVDAFEDSDGVRTSVYSAGKTSRKGLTPIGKIWVQRWEHHIDAEPLAYMQAHGWRREPIEGKVWRSGKQAYQIVRRPA